MATSGSFNTNSTSWYGDGYTLTTYVNVAWTRTDYSIANNTSTISVTATIKSNLGSGYRRGWYTKELSVSGATGSPWTDTTYYNVGGESVIYSKTDIVVPHNNDGTKDITIEFKVRVGQNNSWTCTGSGTFTLDTIPRSSSFALTSSSIYTTENIGMSISRASTSFTHDISISYGSTSASLGTGIGTSLSVAVPAAIKTAMKNANSASASCTITVTTKNGSTAIGSKTGTISISAPNATVSTSVASVAVNSATAQWSLGNTDTGLCTYTVTRSLGSIVYTDQTKTTTTSKNNGANANFLQSTTNAKSGTVTTQVTTFVGSTQVGTNSTTYTVTIPSSYGPSISLKSGYPKKYSDTASYQNLYLAGYSGVQWQATGTVGSGSYASISSLTAEIISGYGTLSNSVSGSTITTSLSKLTASSSNYTEKVRLTVTDSRGYTAYIDSSVSVSGYYLPVFDMENTWAKRATSSGTLDNEGTYANLSAKATTHSNAYITSLVIKTGSTTIKTVSNTSSSTKTLTATQNAYGTYATTSEGSFSATATDSMGKTSTVSFILPKAAVHLSFYEGNPGVGIGTVAEENHLVTALPIITTRTDILHYRNTYGAFNLLFTKDGGDKYGIGVGLGAGGTTIVGAGESASAAMSEVNASNENLWLLADNVVYICTSANTWSSRKTIAIDTNGHITGGTGCSWISARDYSLIFNSANSNGNTGSFYPFAGGKSATGSWNIGTLGDSLYFSYTTNSDYSSGTNTPTVECCMTSAGTFYSTYNIVAGNGNTSAERQVRVSSGAGDLYMFSQASNTGSRGLYVPAHGTGAAKSIIGIDTNNNAWFNGSASETEVASRLYCTRTNVSLNDLPVLNRANTYETQAEAANSPVSNYGFTTTYRGADSTYAAQLWLGESTQAIYYRALQGNTWRAWRQVPLENRYILNEKKRGGTTTSINMSAYSRIRIYALTWGFQHVFEINLADANGKAVADQGLYDSSYPYQGGSIISCHDGSGTSGAITFYQVFCKVSSDKQTFWINDIGYTRPGSSTWNSRNNYDQYYVYRIDGIL